MEGEEKIAEETAGSSSLAGCSECVGKQRDFPCEEMNEKPSQVCDARKGEEEEEEDVDDHKDDAIDAGFVPGPVLSLKEQIEKDKEDDSLRRWKEKLLGCLESDLNGEMDPEVTFHSIGIVSDEIGEIPIALPVDESQSSRLLFTLREGSCYRLKLKFSVLNNIVSGLMYSNAVWKGGRQVDQTNEMLGTFAPQREPYVHVLNEETTPSGILARGIYSAKIKFEDDDKRCHMELKYLFEIKKSS